MLTDTMGDVWSKLTYSLLVASICLFGCVDPQCDSVEKFWDPVVNQCASCPKVCDNGHENDHRCQEFCQGKFKGLLMCRPKSQLREATSDGYCFNISDN